MITYYWSRVPGKFVNKLTGDGVKVTVNGNEVEAGPRFIGSVREWYETLIETLIDVSNAQHRDTKVSPLPCDVTCSPDVMCIFECSVLFKPWFKTTPPCDKCGRSQDVELDMTDEHYGTISNFTMKIDRDMPRNVIKVGNFGEIKVLDINII